MLEGLKSINTSNKAEDGKREGYNPFIYNCKQEKKKSIKQPFSRQAQKPRDDIYKLKKEEAINKNKNEKDSLNYFFSLKIARRRKVKTS